MTNAEMYSWYEWQREVVSTIRDFSEVLTEVREDDVDWDAWRPLYERGLSARAAVADAFVVPRA